MRGKLAKLNNCAVRLLSRAETTTKVLCIMLSILAVRKAGHLNIKTKMLDFEVRVLIGWLANTLRELANQNACEYSGGAVSIIMMSLFHYPNEKLVELNKSLYRYNKLVCGNGFLVFNNKNKNLGFRIAMSMEELT